MQNEHTYTDIMEPEEPKTQDISVRIASTPATNQPLAAANSNSKAGNSGGSSTRQMMDRVGSSDDNEEDENHPRVVIDKSKKSGFTRELAGLDGNLGSAWEAPKGSHRRSRTDHRHGRSGRLEIETAEAN